jgi:hypothetical protein
MCHSTGVCNKSPGNSFGDASERITAKYRIFYQADSAEKMKVYSYSTIYNLKNLR